MIVCVIAQQGAGIHVVKVLVDVFKPAATAHHKVYYIQQDKRPPLDRLLTTFMWFGLGQLVWYSDVIINGVVHFVVSMVATDQQRPFIFPGGLF